MPAELARILESKRDEIASLRGRPLPAPPALRPCNMKRAAHEPLRILAEIKFKSPSAGNLSTQMSVAERTACYERAGASVVSVLCDRPFFGGSYEHLAIARQACSLPILCKEFVLDEVQLDWARAFGADLVLIIARCLTRSALSRLHQAAVERGLVPLVEIATLDEANWVKEQNYAMVGVNARDLDSLQMDAGRAQSVLHGVGGSRIRVHLSGLKTADDVAAVARSGVDAALIGESLMRQADPEPFLRSLVQAASPSV
jgi:indole-3-glycerol phosphate synthase